MKHTIPPTLANIVAALGYTPANKAGDTFTGPVIAPDGTITAPGFAFTGDTGMGWARSSAGVMTAGTSASANGRLSIASTSTRLPSNAAFGISSATTSVTAADVALSRIAAGVFGVGTGTVGSVAGTIQALRFQSPDNAFAAYPAAAAGNTGSIAYCNDSTTIIPGATVTGGGANKIMMWSDGTNWKVLGI